MHVSWSPAKEVASQLGPEQGVQRLVGYAWEGEQLDLQSPSALPLRICPLEGGPMRPIFASAAVVLFSYAWVQEQLMRQGGQLLFVLFCKPGPWLRKMLWPTV